MIDGSLRSDERLPPAKGVAFSFSGIGYHTGRPNRLRFQRAGRSVACIRIGDREISLRDRQFLPDASLRCTTFGGVGPVEHLLAAVCILGVEGWILEAEHEDLPLFDGSASMWENAILATGLAGPPLLAPRLAVVFECADARGWIRIRPSEQLELRMTWTDGVGGAESWSGGASELGQLLKARTFVRSHDFARARGAGLLVGVGPDSGRLLRGMLQDDAEMFLAASLGVDPSQEVWTGGPARQAGECAAHKALDLIGDFHLGLGGIPLGKIEAMDSGHCLHLKACQGLG